MTASTPRTALSETSVAKVLTEIESTECAYNLDLAVLCDDLFPAFASVDKAASYSVFANVHILRGINQELLSALQGQDGPPLDLAGRLERVAVAFSTIAPYLRGYATFCTAAVMAQERLSSLRAGSASLDAAVAAVEQITGQSAGSWLIKPVQRLCKYPLLLGALVADVPPSLPGPHASLVAAHDAIRLVVDDVNQRVRAAEEREGLLVLAEALKMRDLVTPTRSLLASTRVIKMIETHTSTVMPIEGDLMRLARLDLDR